jgi:hypothetical protein
LEVAPLDTATSVDTAATFSSGAAPELCVEALPARRMPKPKTRASSNTMAKAKAAPQNHPAGRLGSCSFPLGWTVIGSTGLGSTSVGSTVIGSNSVGWGVIGCAMVEGSAAKELGGSAGTGGNGCDGTIRGASSLRSSSGASKTSAAGETALGAGCGASTGNSSASRFGPGGKLTGFFGEWADAGGSGGLRMKSTIGAFK